MADESKTYLVNIESNIAQYAEDAAKAKKEVDQLTEANKQLKESGATPEEIEASNAQLKLKNEEYRKAQGLLKTAISLTQSETGSRKALGEQLKLQEQALGKLGSAYITDANGIKVLNPLYIEQRKQIAQTKQAIIDYDLALNDGRSNIGRYGESIKTAMGESGNAVSQLSSAVGGSVGQIGNSISQFLSGGILGALAGAIGLVASAWKKTQENIELYLKSADKVKEGIGAFERDAETARKDARARAEGQIAEGLRLSGEYQGYLLRMKDLTEEQKKHFQAVIETGKQMIINGRQVVQDTYGIQNKLEWERKYSELLLEQEKISDQRLENETRWQELEASLVEQRRIIIDLDTTIEEKAKAKVEAERIGNQLMTEKLAFNQQEYDNLLAISKMTATEEVNEAELNRLLKERNTIQKEFYGDQIKVESMQRRVNKSVADANKESAEQAKKKADEEEKIRKANEEKIKEDIKKAEKYAEDKWQYELEIGRKLYEQNKKLAEQQVKDNEERDKQEIKSAEEREKRKTELIQAGLQGAEAGANAIFEAKRNRLNAEMTAELSNQNLTEAQKVEINKKYAKLQQKADISQAIINGALAIGNALATTKPFVPAGLIAGALAAVQTAAQIAVIKSQSFDGGGSASAPTTITASPVAQRAFATNTGATIFTQPQLSQGQLNALPNENLLTANDIAEAIKKIPPPIVTVEDINAKTISKNKVEVRATI